MTTRTELLEIIASGENSGVEFKRDDLRTQDLAKELVAFSNLQGGIVKLTDCRLFSAFFHEAKPLKLRKAAIDNLPRFWSESI